jgi:osmotically-inducible protein OsmY
VVLVLQQDRFLDAGAIQVAASNGIVQLSGRVGTLTSKARAARVAATRRGVRVVVNRIQRELERRPDAEVARDVRRALRNQAATANLGLSVTVSDGVVTLAGTITSLIQQELAERAAGTVRGVRFCHNDLGVSRVARRSALAVLADVRSRLDWDPLLSGSTLEVVIENGRIRLSGRAKSELQRRQAIRDAWVKGVVAVDASGVLVEQQSAANAQVRTSLPTDLEIASAIRDAVAEQGLSKPSTLSIGAASGVVTLAGTTETFAESRLVEALALSAVGVVRVESQLRGPWWKPAAAPAARPAKRAGSRKR